VTPCPICLDEGSERRDGYHDTCVLNLLGPPAIAVRMREPAKDLTESTLVEFGRGSISGVQPKVLVRRSADGAHLEVVGKGGLYILKPQTNTFPSMPENEHTMMSLGRLVGLNVPPCGLVRLGDNSWAYLIRRFDRSADGAQRYRQEDFCALAGFPAEKKYDKGSAELCMRILRTFLDPVDVPAQALLIYRQFLFSWWAGNGDLHLKNLSLSAGHDGRWRLTPVYDLVCSELVILHDSFALPLDGRRTKLDRAAWEKFARYCGIRADDAAAEIGHLVGSLPSAEALVGRSHLPGEMKARLVDVLHRTTDTLQRG
jgi:serine/threonine-protein kinase HipA